MEENQFDKMNKNLQRFLRHRDPEQKGVVDVSSKRGSVVRRFDVSQTFRVFVVPAKAFQKLSSVRNVCWFLARRSRDE
jgi:hypothetical protein